MVISNDNQVYVGFARNAIEVPAGTPMGGYQARSKPSTGVHDTLFVNCIAISKQGVTLATHEMNKNTICICSIDVVGLEKHRTLKVKEEIKQKFSIPVENILVSAIHTHSGPLTIELFAPPWKDFEIIYDILKSTIEEALQNLKPSLLEVGKGHIPGVSFNRRTYDKLSEIINDEVVILKVVDAENTDLIRGILYNFSNHPVVMGAENLQISEDWPYFTNQALKSYLIDHHKNKSVSVDNGADEPFVVFIQGTPGNLNPINTPMDKATHHTFDDCKFIGDKTAKALIEILESEMGGGMESEMGGGMESDMGSGMGPFIPLNITENSIKCKMEEVKLSIEDEDKAEIFTFADVVEEKENPTNAKSNSGENVYYVSTFCQVICLGELTIVGLPGEVFSHLGLEIKEMSRKYLDSEYTMVVGYANDYIGYFGPKEIYVTGGYEMLMMSLSENEGPEVINAVEQILKKI